MVAERERESAEIIILIITFFNAPHINSTMLQRARRLKRELQRETRQRTA
jgi:hypothetical protein